MRKPLIIVFLLLTAMCANAQRTTSINQNPGANEPSVAVNRSNPANIIAASNLNTVYYSFDTGYTWHEYALTSKYGFYGDPVLHAANDGSVYITHLSKTAGKAWGEWFDRIVVQRSVDGGRSFSDGIAVGFNGNKTQDKPWLSGDEVSKKYRGNLYLTWTEFDKYGSKDPEDRSRIRFSYSNDKGETWSKAITISDRTGDCSDNDHTLEGATIAVDETGTIYCVWAGHDSIYMDRSSDGGITWGKDRVIGLQPGGWNRSVAGLFRGNGMPFITSDARGSDTSATLYVAWTVDKENMSTVTVIRSMDYGETWSKPHFPNTAGGDHLFVNMAADPENKMVYLLFNQVDTAGSGYFMRTCLAVWPDGTNALDTIKKIPLNRPAVPPAETIYDPMLTTYEIYPTFALPGAKTFFGDYLDVDIAHGSVHMVYTTTRSKGGMNIQHSVIPVLVLMTEKDSEDLLTVKQSVAVSFKDSVLYWCIDHVSYARLKVKNYNSWWGKSTRSIYSFGIKKAAKENKITLDRQYGSVATPYRRTKVKQIYYLYDGQKSRVIKVKRKTIFIRKEVAVDIH